MSAHGTMNLSNIELIENLIFIVRNQKVILDSDLARVYGVSTKAFNQAIKRNIKRFPEDFMFQLSVHDIENVRGQALVGSRKSVNRSQIVTGSQKHRDPRFMPYAFTEHGAIMAANILRSDRAIAMSVYVIRHSFDYVKCSW